MYLSHPVRRIREDPDPDETVGLVVELDDGDSDGGGDGDGESDGENGTPLADLRAIVDEAGGHVGRDLGFGSHHVVVPETAVDDLCESDAVVRIETDATITLDIDAEDEAPDDDDLTVDDLRDHVEGDR